MAVGVAVCAALGSVGCPPTTPSEGSEPDEIANRAGRTSGASPVVATVNGEEITRRDFERRVEALPKFVRARYQSSSSDRELLAAVAQFEVLADIAERRGLGTSQDAVAAVKSELERLVIDRRLEQELDSASGEISDEDVEAYYREHIERYRQPERRRGLVIATTTEARAERVRRQILEGSTRGDDRISVFRERAAGTSVAPASRVRGGAVGWLKRPEEEQDRQTIADVVYGLEKRGELSEVFRVDERWYVATWAAREEASTEPLENVAGDIRQELREQRRESLRDRLTERWRKEASIEGLRQIRTSLESPDDERLTRPEQIPIRTVDRSETGESSPTREKGQ